MTSRLLHLALAVVAAAGLEGAEYYGLSTEGPRNIYAGYSIYVQLAARFPGAADHVYFQKVELPAGLSFHPICNNGTGQCWKASDGREFIWNTAKTANCTLHFQAAEDMAPGEYTARITTQSLGLLKTIDVPVRVFAKPSFLVNRPSQSPPIAGLSQWEQTALTAGKKWCKADETMNFGWSQQIWYYDGARVYFQLADYTGDRSWEACALNIAGQYRDKVISGNGYMAGYKVFPHGLRMAYARTGDETYKQALILLSQKAAFGPTGGGVTDDVIRETAYAAQACMEAEKAGAPRNPLLSRSVDYLLGHYEVIFERQQYRIHQPFFDGLAAAALIEYWEMTGDPRIPAAIRRMLDWTWEHGWDRDRKAMVYDPDTIPQEYGTDLVNLIAPAFAWYYSITGDTTYRRRGDELFRHAIDSDVSYSGKNFSQNYRWSFAYVNWRGVTAAAGIVLPERAAGSSAIAGEVVLMNPAVGPCGQSVRLSSSDKVLLSVPSSVKLAAGTTSAPVSLDARPVDLEEVVTVTATYERSCDQPGSTMSIPITIAPDEVRLLLNRQTLAGGSFVNSRVVLDGNVPEEGYDVELTADRPDRVRFLSADGPISTVRIDRSAKASECFLIDTGYVSEPTAVTIMATAGKLHASAQLTITPPVFRIALLGGPTITGGGSMKLNQVVLDKPAPAGGTRVELSTSSPVLYVPEAVTVPEGAISAWFGYRTAVVGSFTSATITARNGLDEVEAGVSVNALLLSLSVPQVLKLGTNGAGTVTLSAPAPDDLAVVLSAGENSPIVVPPSVVIQRGQKSAVFSIGSIGSAAGAATITATLGDQVRTGKVSVEP